MLTRSIVRWGHSLAAVSLLCSLTGLSGGAALAASPRLITQAMLPYTIDKPGNYWLAGNLSYTGSVAILIKANNVYLNGAGYTLDGLGSGTQGIVVLGASWVSIQNVTVTGFRNGIGVSGGNNIALVGNTASGNLSQGISVSTSRSTLIGNTTSHNRDGMAVFGSNNLVSGNTANENGGYRIDVVAGGTGNLVQGNTTLSNGDGGILVGQRAVGNTIRSNTALSNGISLSGGWDLIDGNDPADCSQNTWVGNTFSTAFPSCLQ